MKIPWAFENPVPSRPGTGRDGMGRDTGLCLPCKAFILLILQISFEYPKWTGYYVLAMAKSGPETAELAPKMTLLGLKKPMLGPCMAMLGPKMAKFWLKMAKLEPGVTKLGLKRPS